jgi:hypothetical protein
LIIFMPPFSNLYSELFWWYWSISGLIQLHYKSSKLKLSFSYNRYSTFLSIISLQFLKNSSSRCLIDSRVLFFTKSIITSIPFIFSIRSYACIFGDVIFS